MKKTLLLFCLPLLLNSQSSLKKIRVLFLGNSYTYVNNLPQLAHDLALSLGDTLVFDSYCPGGYTFNNHASDAATLSKISLGNWDYVVLQAQSQEPSFSPGQVSGQTLPYAIKLDSIIKHYNPCAYTVFYETWGRKNGDAANCPFYPPICTYLGMQNRLRDSYRLFADTVHGLMAPVGEAWRLARATNTLIDFYQSDESHPLIEGSYLAAAVFYETLFQKSVLSSTYNPGIGSSTVTLLNQVAHQLVTDSTVITNIPKYKPVASFTANAQSTTVFQFTSGAPNFSHFWNFGDGSVSTAVNPSHTYTLSGNYMVNLIIKNAANCLIDSTASTIQVATTVGLLKHKGQEIRLYPNPCSTQLIIQAGNIFDENVSKITVTNYLGQVIEQSDFKGYLNVSSFENGIYYIKISNNNAQANSCFIKNE
ncbi:PKD domain-containing protein [Aurantibacillus circumpalustris]|uniref:PKD domain-containing protein n=1 Tax=Aurantibacillus circumpalustris TaxID=3036359 RepID=UPI00295B9C3C|nr:PKD domain-containing protein [Aurantibacillus circumpalustris]